MKKDKDFIQLIKDHEGIIFKITSVYTHSADDQSDLYQDVVYQLWKSFHSFRNESKISTWMYRIALNTAITHIKKKKRVHHEVPINQVVLNRIEEYDTIKEDQINELYDHIQHLNTIEKGMILLYLEGKSHDEIAEITGFTISNVGTRISRIKKKLKSQINK